MKDLVAEYSAKPSSDLEDYFLPAKTTESTSSSLHRIEETNCASIINIGLMKAIVFGDGHMPHTLVMAVEQVHYFQCIK